jgi:hypothetical protein
MSGRNITEIKSTQRLNLNTLLICILSFMASIIVAIFGYFGNKTYEMVCATHDAVITQGVDIITMKEDIKNRPTQQEVRNEISARFGSPQTKQ